jgi:hypothetical protein
VISEAFRIALLKIPTNPFWVTHRTTLLPLCAAGILAWHGANTIEMTGKTELLHVSHSTRYSLCDALPVICAICRGWEFARVHAAELRLMHQRDSLAHYLSEHETVPFPSIHGATS